MKRLLLLILVVVVILPSCHKSQVEITEEEPHSGITLQLNVSGSSIVHTKAQSADEVALNNLWLFTYNTSGILVQKRKATDIKNDVRNANISIPNGVGLNFYACANVSSAEESKFEGLLEGSATVADLKAITSDRSLLRAPGLPMWGELKNQTITTSTTSLSMTLTRSCSRIDVVATGVADFSLSGIEKILKTATDAPIFPAGTLVSSLSTVDDIPTNKGLSSIYLYENAIVATDEASAESKATAIIIKGIYKGYAGYYKLRVKYSSPIKYDIGRNVIYSINITSVKAPGFATLAEAEANFPQNVDYTATASDGDATDLVTSNGQYYLGVSNSEYAVYNSDALSNVPVVTVTHNAPSSITDGTIAATGTGLTLLTKTINTSTQKQEVMVDMAVGFTSGTITIRLGNLMKVVNIKKRPTVSMTTLLNADYSANTYVQGDLDETTPLWFKLSKDGLNTENTQKVQNPSGGIWMYFVQNIGISNQSRSSGAYLTSADSKGRSRIVVKQDGAIFQYVNGVPTSKILPISPASFTINLKTDLPGWTIGAYDNNNNPVAITLGSKTGVPVRGTAKDCSIIVTVPNNLGAERTIYFYFAATEDPKIKIVFASVVQEKNTATIKLDNVSQPNIPYTGGTYTVKVTSNTTWAANCTNSTVTITPLSGAAGETTVQIKILLNPNPNLLNVTVNFVTSIFNGTTATASWSGSQIGAPDYYVGRFAGTIVENTAAKAGETWYYYSKQLFIAYSGESGTYTWGAATTTGASSIIDGKGNTAKLATSAYPAAYKCYTKTTDSKSWYLPALSQLMGIWVAKPALGSFTTTNDHWTSTESSATKSWLISFNTGFTFDSYNKSYNNGFVRCAREEDNSSPTNGPVVIKSGSKVYIDAQGMPDKAFSLTTLNVSHNDVSDYNKVYKRIEIPLTDDFGVTSWTSAKTTCSNKGAGWRLPTQRELMLMIILKDHLVKAGVSSFKPFYYWTSTETIDGTGYWAARFDTGFTGTSGSTAEYNVRCVREV